MRLFCHFCGKSVSNEVPDETVVRAILICPECVEAKRVTIGGDHDSGSQLVGDLGD